MRNLLLGWWGRLGNNIQQVANGIMHAEHEKTSFEQHLGHDIINKFFLDFGGDGPLNIKRFYGWQPIVNCDCGSFDGVNEIGLSPDYVYSNMRRICQTYVYPNLKINHIAPLDNDTLVIHIRGGDMVQIEYERPQNYVQNPLSFYLSLIPNFKRTIVVFEPNSNHPVIDELKKIPDIEFQSTSLDNDYATLMAARNLATSGVGTFATSAALCSKNLKNLFYTNVYLTECLNGSMLKGTDVTVHELEIDDYIPVYPCSWVNNAEQRKLMIEYQIKNRFVTYPGISS